MQKRHQLKLTKFLNSLFKQVLTHMKFLKTNFQCLNDINEIHYVFVMMKVTSPEMRGVEIEYVGPKISVARLINCLRLA